MSYREQGGGATPATPSSPSGGGGGWFSRFWGTSNSNVVAGTGSSLKEQNGSERGSTRFLTSANTEGQIKAGVNAEYQERDQRLLNTIKARAPVDLMPSRDEYDRLAIVLFRSMERGVHRRRIHAYEDTFWGKSATDYMVATQVVDDAADARNVMRNLLKRRVILRMDHTRPFFNSSLSRVMPKIAESREATLRIKHQMTETDFRDECLYAFNPSAFCTEQIVVTIMGAQGLKYKSRLSFGPFVMSAKFREQNLDAYAQLSFQGQLVQSSIVHSNANPVWDEEFSLLISFDSARKNSDLWIRVFDFHEVLDDYELGIACLTMDTIRRKCENGKRWRSKHLLLPSTHLDARTEATHGEIELEIEIRPYYADHPDWTVFPAARETVEQRRIRLGDGDEHDGMMDGRRSENSTHPSASDEGRHSSAGVLTGEGTVTDRTIVAMDKLKKGLTITSRRNLSVVHDGDRFDLVVSNAKIHSPGEPDMHMRDRFFWVEYKVGSHRVCSSESTVSQESFKDPNALHDLGGATLKGLSPTHIGGLRLNVIVYMRTYDFVRVRLADGSIPLRRFLEADDDGGGGDGAPSAARTTDDGAGAERRPLEITLRRPAAFKRDVKKKVGMLFLTGSIEKVTNEGGDEGGGGGTEDESGGGAGNGDDASAQETLDVEPNLAALRDAFTHGDSDPASFVMPEPLKNPIASEKVRCSMMRLTVLLMSSKSPLLAAFAKQMNYTDFKVGEWTFARATASSSVTEQQQQPPLATGDAAEAERSGGNVSPPTSPSAPAPPPTSGDAGTLAAGAPSKSLASAASSGGQSDDLPGKGVVTSPTAAVSRLPQRLQSTILSRGKSTPKPIEIKSTVTTTTAASPDRQSMIRQESLRNIEDAIENGAAAVPVTPGAPAKAPPAQFQSAAVIDGGATVEDAGPPAGSHDPPRRTVSYIMPASALVKSLKVNETHEIGSWVPSVGLVLHVTGETPDAPYGSTFKNAIQIVITSQGRDQCMLTISSETRFSSRPFGVVNVIENGAAKGAKDAYSNLIKVLHTLVRPKKKAGAGEVTIEEAAPEVVEVLGKGARAMRACKRACASLRSHALVIIVALLMLFFGMVGGLLVALVWLRGDRDISLEEMFKRLVKGEYE